MGAVAEGRLAEKWGCCFCCSYSRDGALPAVISTIASGWLIRASPCDRDAGDHLAGAAMKPDAFPNRPWSKGNNPMTAVNALLASNRRFEVDREMDEKLLITVAPRGYLRCLTD